MLSTYLKLALRNLSNNRLYSAINILGLAVGIAACLLIFRIVHYELSFNKHFRHYDRIVRVVTEVHSPTEGTGYTTGIPIPAMDAIQTTVPQFEQYARIKEIWPTITVPDATGGTTTRKFNTDDQHELGIFAEPAFFKIFDWQWLAGDPETALDEPGYVVLTQKMAEKCFDTWQAALGKTLLMDNAVLLTVKGVVANAPDNTNFPFHLMASYETLKKNTNRYFYGNDWGSTSSNDQVFALLHDAGQLAAAGEVLATVGQAEYKKENPNFSKKHRLQRLADLHYDDRFGINGSHVISKSRLWVLSLVGVLILVMACFNFINLATALAARRAREVGVRKTLGGNHSQLVRQFMGETTLIVFIAVALGAVLASLSVPMLKHISEVPSSQPFFSNLAVWAFLAVVLVVVSFCSGFYPALVLAGFNPIKALKNNTNPSGAGGGSLRKSLVVLQFAIAQALIIGTLVTISQLDYIRKMDLGFQPDLVYTVQVDNDSISRPRFETFKQKLLQLPGVESVSLGNDPPASSNYWQSNFALGRGADDALFNTSIKYCDPDYFKTYSLQLETGRILQPSDTMREVVVNQTLLRKLGIQDANEVLGKELRLGGSKWLEVVGVVKDFNSHSLHQTLEPIVMLTRKEFYNVAGAKIRPENMTATVAAIQKTFDETFPEQVYDGAFLDESIADFYRSEQRFSLTCKGFAVLAIFISCLGLFGLASLIAVQKTKEIGIRKVLGASVGSVVGLLSRDFLLLVLVAFVVAAPVAWWGMSSWLQDFAFRVSIGWGLFAITGVLALMVAMVAISFQALRAALVNPVESLRSE
ncbi:MAG: ABC transporter permease [Saprospiraceae bacterium]|nr:ABC transporter permease [Saprospiraceae bacterium]MCW5925104.1 ABC transporter permease [Saprospiraceae bacterium]